MTVFVVICATIIVFLVISAIPGDPAEMILGSSATLEQIEAKRHQLGLDLPIVEQLGKFLFNVFIKFDFGTSWYKGVDVLQGMIGRMPRTLSLSLMTLALNIIIGVPLGTYCALRRNKWQDRVMVVCSLILSALPQFWLAIMMIILFSLKLGWLPSFGIGSWLCYIMPVMSGVVAHFCILMRNTRANVLDVVNADYVTTARAKGVRDHDVTYRHILPNALIPILTSLGASLANSIGGSILLEKIFSFPGLGMYMSTAISGRDYPIVRGCAIIIAAFTSVIMLLVDLSYAYVDPRVKAQFINSTKRKGKIRVKATAEA
jgi:peptide/nickel transport system permease protein